MTDLAALRIKMNPLAAAYRSATDRTANEQTAATNAAQHLVSAEAAQHIIQQAAQTVQQQAHTRIAGIVSKCLSTVFDAPYEFRIVFERKRGTTEAKMVFCRDGIDVDPLDAAGGGVVDVAAFALRLACLVLSQPQRRRLLVLDEPLRFLSEEYQPRVAAMFEMLAAEMGVQFLIVTHVDALQIGAVVHL